MLGPHVIVVQALGFFLSDQDDALGAFCETVRHWSSQAYPESARRASGRALRFSTDCRSKAVNGPVASRASGCSIRQGRPEAEGRFATRVAHATKAT